MQLTIEKMIYGGDGLGRLPGNEKGPGKAVFVPFTLPGEHVEARVREEKPGFARASISQILQPSPERIAAPCPYFQRCGGCHYQHATYEHQLQIKADILKENLRRLAKLEFTPDIKIHPSPPWNYRNRARLHLRFHPEFALGYHQSASHDLLPVENCPISSPLLNRAIEVLWALGRAGKFPAEISSIECFANAEDRTLQVGFYINATGDAAEVHNALSTFTATLCKDLPEVVSIYALSQQSLSEHSHPSKLASPKLWTLKPGDFVYQTKAGPLRVSGGSFFQVNRYLVDELVETVADSCSGDFAFDLYAGAGLFTVILASSFRHVVAVESSQSAAPDLQYNSPENVKVVRSTVDEYLTTKAGRVRPDLIVADPPRAGLGDRVSRGLIKLRAPRLMYVSCDPATLARDLKALLAGGYRIAQLHMVDLFPQTYHIETVAELVR